MNDKNISVCGSDCAKCYCFGEMCPGCNACLGRVFHAGGEECAIYACCVNKHRYATCASCDRMPCEVWQSVRDPSMTDEQFQQSVNDRVFTLKKI